MPRGRALTSAEAAGSARHASGGGGHARVWKHLHTQQHIVRCLLLPQFDLLLFAGHMDGCEMFRRPQIQADNESCSQALWSTLIASIISRLDGLVSRTCTAAPPSRSAAQTLARRAAAFASATGKASARSVNVAYVPACTRHKDAV